MGGSPLGDAKHQGAYALPRFEVAMRLGGLGQQVTAGRRNPNDAGANQAEEALGMAGALICRIGEMTIVRPRQRYRFRGEPADIRAADGTGGLAVADQVAGAGERGQRGGKRVAAHRVEGDVGALACGQALYFVGNVLAGGHDHRVRAVRGNDARLIVAGDHGDCGSAEMARPLQQDLADAAGGGMDERDLAAAERMDVVHQEAGAWCP